MRDTISIEKRNLIITKYIQGSTPKHISTFLKIKLVTIYKIIGEYKKHGKVAKLFKDGDTRSKLTNDRKKR
jgi:transposase